MVGPEKDLFFLFVLRMSCFLTSESVECASLSLEGIDDVHGRYGLPLGVFGVGYGVSDDVLEEDFEYTSSLFVDQTGDTLDSSTSG